MKFSDKLISKKERNSTLGKKFDMYKRIKIETQGIQDISMEIVYGYNDIE